MQAKHADWQYPSAPVGCDTIARSWVILYMEPPARRFHARFLLPIGFCGVFLLMATALVESYRMQEGMQRTPATFAAFDRDDNLIEHVRHGFNQSQNVT